LQEEASNDDWLRALHERGRVLRQLEDARDEERRRQLSADPEAVRLANEAAETAERKANEVRQAVVNAKPETVDEELQVISVRTGAQTEQHRKDKAVGEGRFVDLTL